MLKDYTLKSVLSDEYCMNIIREMQRRLKMRTEPEDGYTLADLGRMGGEAEVQYAGEKKKRGLGRYEKIRPRIEKLLHHNIIKARKKRGRTKYFLNHEFGTALGLSRYLQGSWLKELNRTMIGSYNPITCRTITFERDLLGWLAEVPGSEGIDWESPLRNILEFWRSATTFVSVFGIQSPQRETKGVEPLKFTYDGSRDLSPLVELTLMIENTFAGIRERMNSLCPNGWTIVIHSKSSETDARKLKTANDVVSKLYGDIGNVFSTLIDKEPSSHRSHREAKCQNL